LDFFYKNFLQLAVQLKGDLKEAHVNLGVLYDDIGNFSLSSKHTKLAIQYAVSNHVNDYDFKHILL
jgi:hypothetical protein